MKGVPIDKKALKQYIRLLEKKQYLCSNAKSKRDYQLTLSRLTQTERGIGYPRLGIVMPVNEYDKPF